MDELIRDFVSDDWNGRVRPAEAALESRQAEAIPALIKLLDRSDRVELTNTSDLIYPGAQQYYGHGFIVDYDLDSIAVRAGWALERLAFQNFGFRAHMIDHDKLMEQSLARVRAGGPLFGTWPLKDIVPDAGPTSVDAIAAASAKARSWWTANAAHWNRFGAIREALSSDDPERQFWTMQWLRNGDTRCDGLDAASYARDLRPLVQKLASKSTNEKVRSEAELLSQSTPKFPAAKE